MLLQPLKGNSTLIQIHVETVCELSLKEKRAPYFLIKIIRHNYYSISK